MFGVYNSVSSHIPGKPPRVCAQEASWSNVRTIATGSFRCKGAETTFLRGWAQPPPGGDFFQPFVSCHLILSLPKPYDCSWVLKHTSAVSRACITADAAPRSPSISCSILPSLKNKTQRYPHSSTRCSSSGPNPERSNTLFSSKDRNVLLSWLWPQRLCLSRSASGEQLRMWSRVPQCDLTSIWQEVHWAEH